MFQSTASVLEKNTQRFWRLQQKLNGYGNEKVTIEAAFQETNDIICGLNPARPLANQIVRIENELIAHGHLKARKQSKASVSPIVAEATQ